MPEPVAILVGVEQEERPALAESCAGGVDRVLEQSVNDARMNGVIAVGANHPPSTYDIAELGHGASLRHHGSMDPQPETHGQPGRAHEREFVRMWDELEPIGRDRSTGGYHRYAWSDADLLLREWFAGEAAARGLELTDDGNGNQLAWPADAELAGRGDAVLVGSHLDSVPDGGAYDGPLGVVSAFAALDLLAERGVRLDRPVVVAGFSDEEGARFGIACAGSRLMTGSLAPDAALGMHDRDGLSLAEVLSARGRDLAAVRPRPDILDRVSAFVELHVEQGRGLADMDAAVGVGSAIWPHGRFRLDFTGEANHAGTTLMQDRRDPMLAFAAAVLAADEHAREAGARATFGRVEVLPGGTNAIPSSVRAWLDARAPDEASLVALVEAITLQARGMSRRDGTGLDVTPESVSAAVSFDTALRDAAAALLGGAPVLPTGAGHDAGVLSQHGVPTGMLFVRNPTGVSHSPYEHADPDDCLAGVRALADVLAHLAAA